MAIVVPIVSTWEPKGLDKSIRDISKAEGGWAKTGAAMKALKGPALAVGAGLAAGGAIAVKSASDLGETMNAVEKTFGTSADTIKKYGETAADTAGLSQREFQQMATSTGALLKNMGQTTDEAAANTINLTERAADMASVFNTDVGTALAAINSGLKGEADPLEQFGVGVSAAAVKAYALENGLLDATGALDANGRAAAVQGLLMEQTADYAGDFTDTIDGTANASRRAQAKTENLSAAFGEQLLPYMEAALAVGITMLGWLADHQSAVEKVVIVVGSFAAIILAVNAAMSAWTAVTSAATTVQKVLNAEKLKSAAAWIKDTAALVANTAATVAVKVAQLAAAAASKAMAAAQWLLNAALTANPIGLVVAAIALLIGAFVLAYKKSDAFRSIVNKTFSFLKGAVVGYINIYMAVFRKIWEWAQKVIDKMAELARKIRDAFSFSPPSWLGGIFGRSSGTFSVADVSTRSAGARTYTGPVTINVNGAGDPYASAQAVTRALEGYSKQQGRTPWTPLAVAW